MIQIKPERIKRLRATLDDISYDVISRDVGEAAAHRLPEKIKVFIDLFVLGSSIKPPLVKKALGRQSFEDLSRLGLISSDKERVKPKYRIRSFNNYYFLYEKGSNRHIDFVYLDQDSFHLAENLPYNFKAKNALDLCTGSGIQAVLLSKTAERVTAVELSSRTAEVARFNIILNGLSKKVSVLQGDIYAPVGRRRFDLIVSNPPFMPVPDNITYPLCGRGGEDGLLVSRRIIDSLDKHLTRKGLAVFLSITFGDRYAPFILKNLESAAKRDDFDVDLILFRRTPKHSEISGRAATLRKDNGVNPLDEMRRIYKQAGADHIYVYLVKIKRGSGSVRVIDLC
ncbi:MAG: methyltransferase [Candidatus Omnitrophica bacterium]|nr:methyltransferase [Candidatus Omnitrophota bacterium]